MLFTKIVALSFSYSRQKNQRCLGISGLAILVHDEVAIDNQLKEKLKLECSQERDDFHH